MKRRIIKEFRPLALPFGFALVAASFVAFFKHVERMVVNEESVGFFVGLSSFALFATVLLMAALSFGLEYQQRTMGLLLSQPMERFRLWKEKMLVQAGAIAAVAMFLLLIHEALKLPAGRGLIVAISSNLWPNNEIIRSGHSELDNFGYWILAATFALATLCSSGFWTLIARSTIGGAVFTVASQSFLLLLMTAALEKLGVEDSEQIIAIEIAAICYSGIFFWLGWRRFAALQLQHFSSGEGALSSQARSPAFWFEGSFSNRLRCQPKGVSLNLIRKELRLQKPVFMIAAVMAGGWLITLVLLWIQPGRKEFYDAILAVLSVFYVPLVAVLAASVPLGEEKALGLAHWQLTLPVSARHNWLIRLGTALFVWIGLGFLLPFFLAWIASVKTRVGLVYLLQEKGDGVFMVFIAGGILFVFSFWAITLVSNTIRAVLTALVVLPLLGLIAMLASWFSFWVLRGAETDLLLALSSYGVLSVDWSSRFTFFFTLSVLALVALTQSLVLFRRPEASRNAILKVIGGLAIVSLIAGLWCGDLIASATRLRDPTVFHDA